MVILSPDTQPSLTVLDTASAVIDTVGGTGAAQKLTRKRSPQVVTNWRRAGRLPPDTFLLFVVALAAKGFTAPSALWGITEPDGFEVVGILTITAGAARSAIAGGDS